MASKIILALSTMSRNPQSYSFKAPNKGTYSGVQTNEAPVKYLLDMGRISQILCLITPTAKSAENGALEHFEAEIRKARPNIDIQLIDIPDTGKITDNSMAELLQYLEKGDDVYLDTSGGHRYTIMGVLQLVRLLEYKGVTLKRAVYANLTVRPATLDDVTDLYRSQSLAIGMQELTTYGSVDQLMKYFRTDSSQDALRVQKLLRAVGKMTDAMTLCRLETLEKAMTDYQSEMEAASEVKQPIMREVVSFIQAKFGTKITVPWVVLWCLEHRMLPQALSIYREYMPKYLLRESGLFTKLPSAVKDVFTENQEEYRDPDAVLWDQFIYLATPDTVTKRAARDGINTLRNLSKYLRGSEFAVTDVDAVRRAAWDMVHARFMRNMIVHGNETIDKKDPWIAALKEEEYDTDFEALTTKTCIDTLTRYVKRVYKG